MAKIPISFNEAKELDQAYTIWEEWKRRAELRKLETKTIYLVYHQWLEEELSLMVDMDVLK